MYNTQESLPIAAPAKPDQVAATTRNLARTRVAPVKLPTAAQLAALREEVRAKRVEDDVKIVELDGPVKLWVWLCKRHRESLKPGWFVSSTKEPPHALPCDKCSREAK